MIRHLSISNFILINHLGIDLHPGLNIITGETGAGKSILMGALELLTGERADIKSLTKATEKCIVEAWFTDHPIGFTEIFEAADIEPEVETVIRREILPSGKSRAFVNDTPVTLEVLKRIGNLLIDVHGQHDTLLLATAETQIETLDTLAGTNAEKEAYKWAFKSWRETTKALEALKEKRDKENAELSYKQFVFNELEQANLKEGEQESLEKQIDLLKNSEDIKLKLAQTQALLEGENDMIGALKMASSQLERLSSFSETMAQLSQRTKSIWLELRDIVDEIKAEEDQIHYDPEKIQQVDERLSLLYTLQKKHRKDSEALLIAWRDELSGQLDGFSKLDEEIENRAKEITQLEIDLLVKGKALSELRKKSTSKVSEKLLTLVADMGMPKARFEIEITPTQPSISGIDKVTFRFSANPGLPLAELKNAASGGEFSRLMLAFKCLLAESQTMPTLIFDEIDTGISGEVAMKVGRIMKRLAMKHQVLSITHSAQLASQADAHWFVYKKQAEDSTSTSVRELNSKERLEEVAKMISGSTVSEAGLQTARELIGV